MAYGVTLLQLRTKVRQRTDTVGAQNPTDAELTDYVNDSIAELWDLLVTTYGEDYYHVIAPPFVTASGTASYALDGTVVTANDFFKLAGLDVQQGSIWVPIRRFMPLERTRNQNTNWVIPTFGNVRYRLHGVNLEFIPTPTGVFTMRARYVPRATKLVNDSDSFDAINAWHEYIVCDCGVKLMAKLQQDTSEFRASKAEQKQRIIETAPNRDQGEPNRVVDVSGLQDNYVDDYFDLWR